MGLMSFSSVPGRWVRNGLVSAAIALVLSAGLLALNAAREDALLHERYAQALELAMRSLDAQQAATRVSRDLDRLAGYGAEPSPELLRRLTESLEALAAELAALRRSEADAAMTPKELARAEEAAARLLAVTREWPQRSAAAPARERQRLETVAAAEIEAIDTALADLLAVRRAHIAEAARVEHRADRIARVGVLSAGSLGLVLGLMLTLVAWRSMSTNALLMTQLSQMAREDGLTGVANRRTLDERLPQEMARAGRHKYPLTVVMIDLDHFKRFNDRRGHAAGDELLRNAAQAWLRQLRPSDLLARYGGEEFTLVLPSCGEEQAERMVERLQPLVPERQTFSAGIATWNGLDSAAELLAAADRALLQAKRGGRNRIVIAGREPQISLPLRLVS